MPDAPVPEAPVIRPAGVDDLDHIGTLLSQRDERTWDRASLEWFVCGLDPSRFLAWLAMAGQRPVGLTAFYVRDLCIGDQTRRVAYWANLYIDPEYRQFMLYPRLPMAMFQHIRQSEIDMLYAAVRLREVAATHLKIGFGKIGEFTVLFKPLQPVRLLAGVKGWPGVVTNLGRPVDAVYRRATRTARGDRDIDVVAIEPDELPDTELDTLLSSMTGVRQKWTVSTFRDRFRQTREGGSYRLWVARLNGRVIAAIPCRTGERGGGVRVGVLMDVLVPDAQTRAIVPLLHAIETAAYFQGCDALLVMDGLGAAVNAALRGNGFRPSPERYDLLTWPADRATQPTIASIADWRFAFADHDAF